MDNDFLKSSLQGGIFFNMLAVFVERRCADALDFTAGQRRFEDVGSVDRAFGCAGSDNRMQLVDEEQNISVLFDLVHDGFDALFKLAAVFRARDHQRQIERNQFFLAQIVGNIAANDRLRKPFDNRCFSDPGLADQYRIIFAAAAENENQSLHLIAAADDRIHFAFAAQFRQIVAIGTQGGHFVCSGSGTAHFDRTGSAGTQLGVEAAAAAGAHGRKLQVECFEFFENFFADFFEIDIEIF